MKKGIQKTMIKAHLQIHPCWSGPETNQYLKIALQVRHQRPKNTVENLQMKTSWSYNTLLNKRAASKTFKKTSRNQSNIKTHHDIMQKKTYSQSSVSENELWCLPLWCWTFGIPYIYNKRLKPRKHICHFDCSSSSPPALSWRRDPSNRDTDSLTNMYIQFEINSCQSVHVASMALPSKIFPSCRSHSSYPSHLLWQDSKAFLCSNTSGSPTLSNVSLHPTWELWVLQ